MVGLQMRAHDSSSSYTPVSLAQEMVQEEVVTTFQEDRKKLRTTIMHSRKTKSTPCGPQRRAHIEITGTASTILLNATSRQLRGKKSLWSDATCTRDTYSLKSRRVNEFKCAPVTYLLKDSFDTCLHCFIAKSSCKWWYAQLHCRNLVDVLYVARQSAHVPYVSVAPRCKYSSVLVNHGANWNATFAT